MSNSVNNKRIAKNTLMLWIRMLLGILVSIYTSRVVLQTLGVDDYGIYNVVGGVTALFSFLNTSMAGATSRFLTYEMGTENSARLKDTFSSALIIHIGLALVVLVLAETVGLWFLNYELVIPPERLMAANWVFQFSIFSMMITFTQVPYNAVIIAHEKMDIYAYIELANVFLKLGIVYLLVIGSFDKLILYAFLVMLVSFMVAMAYRVYCLHHFEESKFRWVWNPQILKPMLSFSGWDLYGNLSVSVRNQGTSFLLNMFFGVAVNAAAGIAATIMGILMGFSNNVIMAFKPQIVKNYAAGNFGDVSRLINLSMKASTSLFVFIALPLYWEISYVLTLWLGVVPEYTTIFLRIILIYSSIMILNLIIQIPIHASGNIKKLSFITGSIFLLTLVPMYVVFKLGLPPYWGYVVTAMSCPLAIFCNYRILRGQIVIPGLAKSIFNILFHNLVAICLISSVIWGIQSVWEASFLRLLLVCLTSSLLYFSYGYLFLLSETQRQKLKNILGSKMRVFSQKK